MTGFDASRRWALHPQVAMRPEPFGALLYHFGTRRLSFLKDPLLADVVGRLGAGSAREACHAAGVGDAQLARYERALATLLDREMLVPSEEEDPR
jgi:putative mycofactocin binding protein MftB